MTQNWNIFFGISNIVILLITCYFIYRSLRSPIDAVRIGRQLNNEQQKDNAKRNLFLTLFALRGSPLNYDFVKGLNQIDIVFEDCEPVLDAWHRLYDSLHNEAQVNPERNWEILRVELLSAMATNLGYSRIRQTDMIREYYPRGHTAQVQDDIDFRQAALNYFRMGVVVYEEMLNNTPSYVEKMGKEQIEPKKDQT